MRLMYNDKFNLKILSPELSMLFSNYIPSLLNNECQLTDKDGFSIMRMQCAIYQIYEDSWHVM